MKSESDREGFPLADMLHSWKSFRSHEANSLLQRGGAFWQREYLDRFVRNAEHYITIRENFVFLRKLLPGGALWRSADL